MRMILSRIRVPAVCKRYLAVVLLGLLTGCQGSAERRGRLLFELADVWVHYASPGRFFLLEPRVDDEAGQLKAHTREELLDSLSGLDRETEFAAVEMAKRIGEWPADELDDVEQTLRDAGFRSVVVYQATAFLPMLILRGADQLYVVEGGTWEDVRNADLHVSFGLFGEVSIEESGASLTLEDFDRWIEEGGARGHVVHITFSKATGAERENLEARLLEALRESGCLGVIFEQARGFFYLEHPSVIRVYQF